MRFTNTKLKIGYWEPQGGKRHKFKVKHLRGSPTAYTKYSTSHHPARVNCKTNRFV